MRNFVVAVIAFAVCPNFDNSLRGAETPTRESFADSNDARRSAWQLASLFVRNLETSDRKKFPGIQAWTEDLRKVAEGIDLKTSPEQWPAIDIDALMTRNPNFWQAYYEIAPADPGLMLLQTGLLLSAGEASRASHLAILAGQRPGIPIKLQSAFDTLLSLSQKLHRKPNALVLEGIELHDKGDYSGAIEKYREALALWPQNGLAHYEVGLSLHLQEWVAAGNDPPPPGSVVVNSRMNASPKVEAAFAKARKHDPFRIKAYQGSDQEVIRGFVALAKKGMSVWQKLVKDRHKQVEDGALEQLADACQEANNHELALAIRQILVARRNSFAPADHPFISTSLRKLVPGQRTENVIQRLAGQSLDLRQLVRPEVDTGVVE